MEATPTPKTLKTAQGVLQGFKPLADVLGVHFAIDLADDAPASEWMFAPEVILSDLCDPANRALMVLGTLPQGSPGAHPWRRGRRARIGEGARSGRKEALQTLVELAEGSAVGTPRLRARLCVAVRQELTALVAEWNSLERADEQEGR